MSIQWITSVAIRFVSLQTRKTYTLAKLGED